MSNNLAKQDAERLLQAIDQRLKNVPKEVSVLQRLLKECGSQDVVPLRVLRDRLEFTLEFFTLSIKDVDNILEELPHQGYFAERDASQ